ncbi:AraC family transcriptional regulator [Virgisporangium aurantiacum]|uniref:AraC family transcriptional regulator n=1 Tax=Virgisporangium aurantiacum TaxID=175570 RepID=A0A8J3ZFP7_9ACTN|nr:AraC family transcriptional regulator [Virgisporangium aurantiacum]
MRLAARPGLAVSAVTCGQHHTGWSPPEAGSDYRVVLVRRGRFRRRVHGRVADLDPTVGFLALPGDEEHFAHPAGGDVCTAISLRPPVWSVLTGDADPTGRPVYIDARVDLAHRRLLRAASTGDVDFAVVEHLVTLLAGTVLPGTPLDRAQDRAARDRAARDRAARDRLLVDRAREAIRADDPAAGGLLPLAALLDVSPFRLSRAFSRHLGVSLTRYRNRVRVERALDRLEAGAADLAALAADLGFADQAHLCRTMRDQLGHPPSAVRRLLDT